jgi:hypothetical protein
MTYTFKSVHEVENARIATTGTVTISSSKGISDAEAIDGRAVVRILTDEFWNATSAPSLSFQISEDGTTFYPLYYWSDATPTTAVLASVTVNTSLAYAIPPSWTQGAHSVKIVSGTTGTTTPLAKNRTVTLVYRLV